MTAVKPNPATTLHEAFQPVLPWNFVVGWHRDVQRSLGPVRINKPTWLSSLAETVATRGENGWPAEKDRSIADRSSLPRSLRTAHFSPRL